MSLRIGRWYIRIALVIGGVLPELSIELGRKQKDIDEILGDLAYRSWHVAQKRPS